MKTHLMGSITVLYISVCSKSPKDSAEKLRYARFFKNGESVTNPASSTPLTVGDLTADRSFTCTNGMLKLNESGIEFDTVCCRTLLTSTCGLSKYLYSMSYLM